MGSYNQTERLKKQYISDYPELEVHPINCVPDDRPHGSWTNGVKAWKRGDSGSSDTVMGWFFHPDTETRVGKPVRVVKLTITNSPIHLMKSKRKNDSVCEQFLPNVLKTDAVIGFALATVLFVQRRL